jgi:hypothetical protein
MIGKQYGSESIAKVGADSLLRAASDQVHCNLGEELVILGMKTGVYYGLNPMGTRVWKLLQNPISFGELIRTLLEEHDVEADRCQREVSDFVEQLLKEELIVVEPGWPG